MAADLREIDDRIRTGLAKEDFRPLADFLELARKKHPEREWAGEIDQRIPSFRNAKTGRTSEFERSVNSDPIVL